jgi:uncharacterized repeat protein (TIGR03803 family)
MRILHLSRILAISVLSCFAAFAAAPTLTVLLNFAGGPADGAGPWATLILDANGALYGTTTQGGAFNNGTVFQLTPPATGGLWTETILHSFTGQNGDGADPIAGLVLGSSGAIYGATLKGGIFGRGAVFELTPPAITGGPWTETVLHSFNGSNGADPQTGVILAANGDLYGTTQFGGSANFGVVFQLSPATGGAWTETLLHTFTGPSDDGAYPSALLLDSTGVLYGTTTNGGSYDDGTAFQLTPPSAPGSQWTESILYSFSCCGDGHFPIGGLVFGDHGEFFGTTEYGGNGGTGGAVFLISPPVRSFLSWTEGLVWTLESSGIQGELPTSGVAITANGVLYGTASIGGSSTNCISGCGTAFQLVPPVSSNVPWTEHTLVNFTGTTNGSFPVGGLVIDHQGALYGTTAKGGASGYGTVFQLVP